MRREIKLVRGLRAEGVSWGDIPASFGFERQVHPAALAGRTDPDAPSNEDAPMWRLERSLYLVAALTGLRRGELLGLRWREVDFTAGRIRVRSNLVRGKILRKPKTKRSGRRSVPMVDEVAGELDRLSQASAFTHLDDLVFGHPVTGEPLTPMPSPSGSIGGSRARVTSVTFHELRHTYGTTMAAGGMSLRDLQEYPGRADSKTTQVYAHFQPGKDEVAAANSYLAAARARAHGYYSGSILSETQTSALPGNPMNMGDQTSG